VVHRHVDEPPTFAWVAGQLATGLTDVTGDPAALDSRGFWMVLQSFEGELRCLRFADVRPAPLPGGRPWQRATGAWSSSLARDDYLSAVGQIRAAIGDGEVYQVNLCRRLATPLPAPAGLTGLAARLLAGNPAPHFCVVQAPRQGIGVVSASPERFLSRAGRTVTTQPIKGTAVTTEAMLDKDFAENVMIVDMARNDLSRVAETGSVEVTGLCRVEQHPGLVHLVSTVTARLSPGVGWTEILDRLTPAASISGAPKGAALAYIDKLEPVPREVYCGLLGWVDADAGRADLAVAIRTFWQADGELRFGTGAGITWASDPAGEWEETELKARHLIGLV
jgi:para-aminobenzoate synthetase component 1